MFEFLKSRKRRKIETDEREKFANMLRCDELSPAKMKPLCDLLGPDVYEQMYGKNSAYEVRKHIYSDIYKIGS